MLFSKVLACASLVATAIAQTTSRIAFTSLPQTITAGQPVTLTWAGGDGSPVTLTLQQGTTNNLQTVQLVTGSATGYSYTWTVPNNLPNAQNYAFRIQQSTSEPNYTGMITLSGGVTTGATNAVSATAPPSSSASAVLVASNTTSAANASITTAPSKPASGVAVGTGASVGTGLTFARNTTLSSATLSGSASSSAFSTLAATTTGSGSGASSASSAPSPSKSSGAGTVTSNVASTFALLVCAFAGVAYLG